MKLTFNILTQNPDVRIVHTFEVVGRDEDDCAKKAVSEFESFIGDLTLEQE